MDHNNVRCDIQVRVFVTISAKIEIENMKYGNSCAASAGPTATTLRQNDTSSAVSTVCERVLIGLVCLYVSELVFADVVG